jgi:hypothetical protein
MGVLASMFAMSPAPADEASSAEGYAYGSRQGEDPPGPETRSAVPPLTARHDEKTGLVTPVADIETIASDACIQSGAPAHLQAQMDRASYLGKGGDPAQETPAPTRATVTPPAGYPSSNNCFVTAGTTPSPTASSSGSGGEAQNCEDFDPEAGATCGVTLPLWNGRGYAKAVEAPFGSEIEAEAVARCTGSEVEFMTGAAFSPISGGVQPDPAQPNQPIDIPGLASGSTATFWETNWDPATNTTTDGSDTVWVNGLHVVTPTQDIIISRAEATAECVAAEPSPTPSLSPPDSGFPRDVSLTASKNRLTYQRPVTFTGSVTPATDFFTPDECVEGIPVTIRRHANSAPEGEFEDVGTVQTDSSGNFGFEFIADRNAQWSAVVAKDAPQDCAQSNSISKSVLVRPFVRLKSSRNNPRRGVSVKLTSTIEPCEATKQGSRAKLRRQFKGRPVKVAFGNYDENCKVVWFIDADFKTAVYDVSWVKVDDNHLNGHSRPIVIQTHKKGQRKR